MATGKVKSASPPSAFHALGLEDADDLVLKIFAQPARTAEWAVAGNPIKKMLDPSGKENVSCVAAETFVWVRLGS